MKQTSFQPEYGGVGFYIILAIALLAGLTYAVSKGARFGSKSLTEDQARMAAQEIYDYNTALAAAVQKLRLRGCSETQINFVSAANPANATAPGDGSCDVFGPNGGKVIFRRVQEDKLRPDGGDPAYRFVGRTKILDVGTAAEGELFFWTRSISKDICMKYNDIAGVTNNAADAPVENGLNGTPDFIGTYTSGTTLGDDNDGAAFSGKMTGCYKDGAETNADGDPYYDIYQVLIAR